MKTQAQPIETIPVSDRDVDDPKAVLVWVADGGRKGTGDWAFGWAFKRFDGRTQVLATGYIGGGWKITAWAPLPEPPTWGEQE